MKYVSLCTHEPNHTRRCGSFREGGKHDSPTCSTVDPISPVHCHFKFHRLTEEAPSYFLNHFITKMLMTRPKETLRRYGSSLPIRTKMQQFNVEQYFVENEIKFSEISHTFNVVPDPMLKALLKSKKVFNKISK